MANRFLRGFQWGIVATIAMSLVMLVGAATGLSPMPQPIPLAIVARLIGDWTPQPLLMVTAILAHLCYGGFWAGALAMASDPVTIGKGLGLGVFLWMLMQIVVLPFLGWGVFGMGITPAIALATLVLHAVYGLTYGALMDRRAVPVHA